MNPAPLHADLAAGPPAIAALLDRLLAAEPAFPCADDRASIIENLAPAIWRATERQVLPPARHALRFEGLVVSLATTWLVPARDGNRLEVRAAVGIELRPAPGRRWVELWSRRLARTPPPVGSPAPGVA